MTLIKNIFSQIKFLQMSNLKTVPTNKSILAEFSKIDREVKSLNKQLARIRRFYLSAPDGDEDYVKVNELLVGIIEKKETRLQELLNRKGELNENFKTKAKAVKTTKK